MRKIMLLVSIAALLCAAAVYGSHRYTKNHAAVSVRPTVPITQGYTVEFKEFSNEVQTGRTTRYVMSNGEWFEETQKLNPDGSVDGPPRRQAGLLELGAVSIDDAAQKLHRVGKAAIIGAVRAEHLRGIPNYTREDSLLGYHAVVQRKCTPKGEACTEYWNIPDISDDLFKYASTAGDGSTTVKVATSIILGNPTPFTLPNYPMDERPMR